MELLWGALLNQRTLFFWQKGPCTPSVNPEKECFLSAFRHVETDSPLFFSVFSDFLLSFHKVFGIWPPHF